MSYENEWHEKYIFWVTILNVLKSIPESERSQYHTQYMNEVEFRVYENLELYRNSKET